MCLPHIHVHIHAHTHTAPCLLSLCDGEATAGAGGGEGAGRCSQAFPSLKQQKFMITGSVPGLGIQDACQADMLTKLTICWGDCNTVTKDRVHEGREGEPSPGGGVGEDFQVGHTGHLHCRQWGERTQRTGGVRGCGFPQQPASSLAARVQVGRCSRMVGIGCRDPFQPGQGHECQAYGVSKEGIWG